MTTRASLRQQGEAMRRRLFGDDDGAPAFMHTLNTEASYGAIWMKRITLLRGVTGGTRLRAGPKGGCGTA